MPIHCPKCGTRHDVVEFEAGHDEIVCSCGHKLNLSQLETFQDFVRYFENEEEREKAREIQEEAQLICQMILNDDCPEVDIAIAKDKLQKKVMSYFPDKMETYRMIYESRFQRLWDQFRSSPPSA